MAGKPFKVGRFAHTLRVRLMREHLGIDVDALSEEDLMTHKHSKSEYEQQPWNPGLDHEGSKKRGLQKSKQKAPIGVCASEKSQSKGFYFEVSSNMRVPTFTLFQP
jgi:phospholipase D1/2